MTFNHPKYHLLESYFIVCIGQNMIGCSHIMLTIMLKCDLHFQNMTTFSHKITNNIHVNCHISQKNDSQELYSTWTKKWLAKVIFYINKKNMTHESHIPHQPKKTWLTRVIFHINKKYDYTKSYVTSIKIWLPVVICHIS